MKAVSLLRPSSHYCADSFAQGLRACGYDVREGYDASTLDAGDVLLTWNRHNAANDVANEAKRRGAHVLVAENGYFGRDWRSEYWFALALDHHNGAGIWPRDNGERWRAMSIELAPWRAGGGEVVILPQRSIGETGVAMPVGWAESAQKRLPMQTRVRQHPGRNAVDTLRADLERASCVVTWGSGAAIKALMWGIPCVHAFPKWIGAEASTPFDAFEECPVTMSVDQDRLRMFERLGCAMYRESEILSGEAIRSVLSCATN